MRNREMIISQIIDNKDIQGIHEFNSKLPDQTSLPKRLVHQSCVSLCRLLQRFHVTIASNFRVSKISLIDGATCMNDFNAHFMYNICVSP